MSFDDNIISSLLYQLNSFDLNNITDINPSDVSFEKNEEYCIYYLGQIICNYLITNITVDSDTILQHYKIVYPKCTINDQRKLTFIKGIISLFQSEINSQPNRTREEILKELIDNVVYKY